jgi:hypothetical protein
MRSDSGARSLIRKSYRRATLAIAALCLPLAVGHAQELTKGLLDAKARWEACVLIENAITPSLREVSADLQVSRYFNTCETEEQFYLASVDASLTEREAKLVRLSYFSRKLAFKKQFGDALLRDAAPTSPPKSR